MCETVSNSSVPVADLSFLSLKMCLFLPISQCAGISSIHSTPDGFISTFGSSPFVTVSCTRAVRCSCSSFYHSFFDVDEFVDLFGFAVEEVGDLELFGEGGSGIFKPTKVLFVTSRNVVPLPREISQSFIARK